MGEDPNAPVTLTSSPSEGVAATIASALRERGIPAEVAGGALTGLRAETVVMAQVLVRRADLQLAQDALRAIRSESVDIDWSEVDFSAQPEAEAKNPGDNAWPVVIRWLLAAIVGGLILMLAYDLALMRTGFGGVQLMLSAFLIIALVALFSLIARSPRT